jgi:hypothetical protein
MLGRTIRNLMTGSVVALMGLTTGLGGTAFAAPPADKTQTKASVRHGKKTTRHHKAGKRATSKHRATAKRGKASNRKVTHRKHTKATKHATQAHKTLRHHRVA